MSGETAFMAFLDKQSKSQIEGTNWNQAHGRKPSAMTGFVPIIIECASEMCSVSVEDIKSRSNKSRIVKVRELIVFVAHTHFRVSFSQISVHMKKHLTTVSDDLFPNAVLALDANSERVSRLIALTLRKIAKNLEKEVA